MPGYVKMLAALAAVAILAGSASARTPGAGLFGEPAVKFGILAGSGSRSVRWDKGPDESRLKTGLLALTADVAFARGLDLSLFAGVGFSDPAGTTFRDLPITLEYRAGAWRGFAFGVAARKSLVAFGDFETGARASFVVYSGPTKTWPIEDFAVAGDARGRLKWSGFEIGPFLTYTGIARLAPYLGVSLDWLGGNFRMTEALGELGGDQARKFAQKGLLRIVLGASFELGRGFVVDGGAGIVPAKGTTDFGATVRIIYGF